MFPQEHENFVGVVEEIAHAVWLMAEHLQLIAHCIERGFETTV